MSLKKLSLAAALSIGILTVNGIANAAGCPTACPPQQIIPQEPVQVQQVIVCPQCQKDPCACPVKKSACPVCPQDSTALLQNPVNATCSNCHPNAKIYQRQAFAFPNIGSSSVVMPKGQGIVQIGGDQESIALGNDYPSGLSAAPEMGGALTLYPKNATGAAAPLSPICPSQVMQGTDILRCSIPNVTRVLQSNYFDPYRTGAAAAIPIQPFGNSCDPCQKAVPACPVAQPCDPCQSMIPMGGAAPLSPCDCPTGAAAQLRGNPIPIQTASGMEVLKTVFVPCEAPTGAACPVGDQYPDVNNNMFAGCDINTLTCQGVLAGYPSHYYQPIDALRRSELASAIVEGFNLQGVPDYDKQIFKDVALGHWANSKIDKIYNRGIMTGANGHFRPQEAATKAEALSALAKFIPGGINSCDAQNVLKCYPDAAEVPSWAQTSVAMALNAGITKDLPDSSHIRPNDTTSRSEIASMIRLLRQKLCLEPTPAKTTGAAASFQPKVMSSTIPLLKVQMEDIVTARTSLIGDVFVAKTTEPVTINGQVFPCGSEVRGKVVEVIRPGMGDAGGIRLSFDQIKDGKCKAALPKDILSATVVKENNANIIGRTLAWPFTWTGKVAGIVGRTAGGGVTVVADATEGILNNFGNGTNELFNAKFRAAGRSYLSSGRELGMGIYDLGKTAFSGVAGTLKESGDEIAYVVSPDGSRIAQINPRENLSIAFGCGGSATTGAAAPLCPTKCDPCK